MRRWLLLFVVLVVSNASGQEPAAKVWSDLKAKREALLGLHQEFEVSQTTTADRASRGLHQRLIIDISGKKWRERYIGGSQDLVRIFDGQNLFVMETGGTEYIHAKNQPKNGDLDPAPYGGTDRDWMKAKEAAHQPCGFSKDDHTCVILGVAVKGKAQLDGGLVTRLLAGVNLLAIDTQTGVLVQSTTDALVERGRTDDAGAPSTRYNSELTYSLKQMTYGKTLDAGLFTLPAGLREVKEFTKWDAARINKELRASQLQNYK